MAEFLLPAVAMKAALGSYVRLMVWPLVMVLMPESAQPPSTASTTPGMLAAKRRPWPTGRFQIAVVVLLNGWSYPDRPLADCALNRLIACWSPLAASSAPEALSMALDQVK